MFPRRGPGALGKLSAWVAGALSHFATVSDAHGPRMRQKPGAMRVDGNGQFQNAPATRRGEDKSWHRRLIKDGEKQLHLPSQPKAWSFALPASFAQKSKTNCLRCLRSRFLIAQCAGNRTWGTPRATLGAWSTALFAIFPQVIFHLCLRFADRTAFLNTLSRNSVV